MMLEVQAGDDNFSASLFRFGKFLKNTKSIQVVHDLKRKKSKNGVIMLSAHEFLKDFELRQNA